MLAASESECEEERIGGEAGAVRRAAATLASLAGADHALYSEQRRTGSGAKHPLFKKFRY